ncbi:MAG: zinc-ribbon domain-containing protein, partial [Desulfobacterales bacterium]|nr:zinc-ribbon domain-containing protein [Desulfobacterales bacterium]
MQISCSNCKKVYTVNSSKIPPNVNATRCKACGGPVPLRLAKTRSQPPSASKAATAAPSDIVQISCQYCSQPFRIKAGAIPQGVTSTRCKACGHAISLKPATAAASPTSKSPNPAASNPQTLQIACMYCGKKYSINAAKIPPGVKTAKCKACGRPMSLQVTKAGAAALKNDNAAPQPHPHKAVDTDFDEAEAPVIADAGQRANPIWLSRRALTVAAGILLVLLAGYFAVSHWYGSGDIPYALKKIIGKKSSLPQKPATAEPEAVADMTAATPFGALKLNVPLLLAAMDQNMAEDKKDLRYKMTTSVIKSFGLKHVELFLYSHPQYTFLPVIFASGEEDSSLETIVKAQAMFVQVLEPLPDGSYGFKKDAIPADKQQSFPIDQYRVRFVDDTAIIAPHNFAGHLQKGPGTLHKTRVAQMIAAIAQRQDLAVLAVQFPQNFSAGWQKKIQGNPAVQQNPQAAMMIAMGGGVLAQLSEQMKNVESLALGFRIDEANGRRLSYAQQFRDGVDGSRIYQQLKAGSPDDLDVDGMVLKLIELFNDPRYQHTLKHKNNRLMMTLNWEQADDEAFLAALSEATIGPLFAQGMELTPTEGPVAAQYIDTPRILPSVNVDTLKKTIPAAVQQNLFPGNYWSFGDEPRMTLEFDTLAIPNASLARLKYEIIQVASTDGDNIMRVEENTFQPIINPGSASPGFIEINVKKDTPAEKLATAKIKFHIALPSRLKIFEFVATNDAPGTTRKTDGVSVKLGRLEKDVAKISYRGGASARLYAFDQSGRSLASRESMSGASSASARFQGKIYRLQAVVVEENFEHAFEVTADLNRGKELVLSHKPEDPVRRRYDHRPMQTFVNYTPSELNGLNVAWREAGGMMWNDSLRVTLPRGPCSGDIAWEVHFFGERAPVYLAGSSFHSPGGFSYGLTDGQLKNAHAAFGKVQMELAAAIERVTFEKQADRKTSVQRLPAGQTIKVTFNQNEITLDAGKSDVIQSMA